MNWPWVLFSASVSSVLQQVNHSPKEKDSPNGTHWRIDIYSPLSTVGTFKVISLVNQFHFLSKSWFLEVGLVTTWWILNPCLVSIFTLILIWKWRKMGMKVKGKGEWWWTRLTRRFVPFQSWELAQFQIRIIILIKNWYLIMIFN